ncbi:MAG: NifB/NifX family molybdenum-iron cluster-binding protein [Eubacteriaceae bacterium]|nr:NifB/NifX family molybdenum-iron cluster-binding protein [Eubacteriaceae bacterium]
MRIAATHDDNGEIFQHFGYSQQFKIYDTDASGIVNSVVIHTDGNGHDALAEFLAQCGVSVLICGGIGSGAQRALLENGIVLYGGCSGSADDAVRALLGGELSYDPNVKCDHHCSNEGEDHLCGHHHAQGEHCGCHEEDHEQCACHAQKEA